ncbi:uncharacterized protein LOC116027916 [Ipomoea triloba]|uniref:uncharacterized protein LOC116027916 n=1 Tax=Ipomoea triloba TaxID=35885 RepID=UPI00125D90AA|nr:uncharacterized protein LOC116027916 [Ipomoea triloba]XP_031125555.1 uncharacterized protein LOC116027916 [Ipomoea triloba]XP_031125556.1 uncharacterized protein LOC116027916 [Ipomoea triloba]XP_031125557.1 uncharacterized protein LOC116027916 [Ipomoea triloba]XP_031125558.1 uncharacterized protein LOC116027916 [Ipomoea triloba]XP_031125559.1 uncharacterized protein LOC116027916 [Ipomoea triloba]
MGESFTIQISSNLVKQLADDGEKLKKRSKKPKPKTPPKGTHASQANAQQKPFSEDPDMLKGRAPTGWPLQPALFAPVPPQQPAFAELDAIRSVLQDSEKVLVRLQKQEENMLQEVTQRAKDLHEKEFKLPEHKPIPCLEERDACAKCYKENEQNPLKCANAVQSFADCARRVKQLLSAADK